MKKYFIMIGTAAIATIILIAIVAITPHINAKSVNPNEVKEFSEFFEYPIEKITLRQSTTSPEWAMFDDEDLIAEWNAFFGKFNLKPDVQPIGIDTSLDGGGVPVVVVKSNGKDYSFRLYQLESECRLELNDKVFSADTSCTPFNTTYNEAIARHGIVTPWD